jgi:carboxyl-terminal processing protease
LALTGLYPLVSAELNAPSQRDRSIALGVSTLLKKEHLTKHPLDEEIMHRCVTQFLRTLDPMKQYFLQSDVDQFMARQKEVAKVEQGDVRLAYDILKLYLQRVDERVALVDVLLKEKHDFTVDEELITDRDVLQYPKTEAEAQDRWRKRIKYDLLVLRADRLDDKRDGKSKSKDKAKEKEATEPEKTPEEQAKADFDRLTRRYHTLRSQRHQIDADELLELYLTALAHSFDPHSDYMSPEAQKNFEIQMGLQLEGIGAALRQQDGETTVERLVPGGPAEKEGRLKAGDKIIGVGQGADGAMQDVVEMKLNNVVQLIRGKRGTVVRLEVISGKDKKVIQITRDRVEMKDSEARSKIFQAGKKPDGKPYQIGVVDLPSFYMDMRGARLGQEGIKTATADVRRLLDDFNRRGVDALVLDLRRNGGGSLPEAINLTGLFIDEGPVVQVKGADGRIAAHMDDDGGTAVWKKPMMVLISRFSASASEILAGAIQDYRRGLIVGDRSTHGKGTVQNLNDLGEALLGTRFGLTKYGSLKMTIQQFYRPNGDSTQLRGVVADVELPSITTHIEGISEGDLDYAIPFDQIDPQRIRPYDMVTKSLVERLSQASASRVKSSTDFQQILKRIARYEEVKKRKVVTLNEKKYLAERAEWNADKEEEKKFEELQDTGNEIKRDYYLDECLAIAADYLGAVGQPRDRSAQSVRSARSAMEN